MTETWLSDSILDCEVTPPNYTILRKDRGSRGGGVAILVKNGIVCTPLPDCPEIECLCCKIAYKNTCCYILVLYRPLTSTSGFFKSMYSYINDNINVSSKIIIAGDFNLPSLEWSSLSKCTKSSLGADILTDLCFHYNLTQIVN